MTEFKPIKTKCFGKFLACPLDTSECDLEVECCYAEAEWKQLLKELKKNE